VIEAIENKYNGIIIDSSTIAQKNNEFKSEIVQLLKSIPDKKLIWIKITIEKSAFIPILTSLDFEFHHCDKKNIVLVKKIADDPIIPTTINYIVGVGAIVFNKGHLLVIRNRHSTDYKLPGGHVDNKETIKNALHREVFEETGINIEFESIVNIGHFRNGQFGESNLYIVCTAKALSENIMIYDSSEIVEAKWISPVDFLNYANVNNYNKSVVKAAINNKELKLTEQQINLRTPGGEVFF